MFILSISNAKAEAYDEILWPETPIEFAIDKGFVPKDLQGDFESVITRAEFCRLAVGYLEYVCDRSIDEILANNGVRRDTGAFSDTKDSDVLAAFALGVTGGTLAPTADLPGLFTPDGSLSREQAAAMIAAVCRVFAADTENPPSSGITDIGSASGWARNAIDFCLAYGIMEAATPEAFNPKAEVTREHGILAFYDLNPGSFPALLPEGRPAWYRAYYEIISKAQDNDDFSLSLLDINSDGTPEMYLYSGMTDSISYELIHMADNTAMSVDATRLGGFYTDKENPATLFIAGGGGGIGLFVSFWLPFVYEIEIGSAVVPRYSYQAVPDYKQIFSDFAYYTVLHPEVLGIDPYEMWERADEEQYNAFLLYVKDKVSCFRHNDDGTQTQLSVEQYLTETRSFITDRLELFEYTADIELLYNTYMSDDGSILTRSKVLKDSYGSPALIPLSPLLILEFLDAF
jgi:hypothetical protein